VLVGVRRPRAGDERRCDFGAMRVASDWSESLAGVDAVVNVAGILRQTRSQRFAVVHHDAPLALAQACVAHGVRRFVQISALGEAADGEFIASKHRFDAQLLALPLDALVLRPSVVYSTAGSYGGTSLLRALAAAPGVLAMPGDGSYALQPIAAEDLAAIVVRALDNDVRGIVEIGGPQSIALRDYLQQWREWLRLPRVPVLQVPASLIALMAAIGDLLGRGPMGGTTWRMLRRGNVPSPDAHRRLVDAFGVAPRALQDVLAARPSQVQDRWQAQLHLLATPLRLGMGVMFLVSAWAGFVTPAAEIEALTRGSMLAALWPVELSRVAAGVDLLLGLALLANRGSRATLLAMLALVVLYTLAFGVLRPALWLDPLGGLVKNLVVLPALAVLWVLSERR
jgi:hypothetical protein